MGIGFMHKIIQLIIRLTCALILCINCAEARRMNPDLMKPPIPQTANQQDVLI